jgi:hypothetical protein
MSVSSFIASLPSSLSQLPTWLRSHPIVATFILLYLFIILFNLYSSAPFSQLKLKENEEVIEVPSYSETKKRSKDGHVAEIVKKKFHVRRTRGNGDSKMPVIVFESRTYIYTL